MTLTLTPELEYAVNEKAKRQGVPPEHLAMRELKRLFLPSAVPTPSDADAWETQVHRYQSLVEKDFLGGLTAEEAQECERLGAAIDAAETP